MNDHQLKEKLKSTGRACFVKYFQDFSNESLSRHDLIEFLIREEGYKEPATGTRISNARSIIKAGCANRALNLIVESARVPKHIRDEARRLSNNLPQMYHRLP